MNRGIMKNMYIVLYLY